MFFFSPFWSKFAAVPRISRSAHIALLVLFVIACAGNIRVNGEDFDFQSVSGGRNSQRRSGTLSRFRRPSPLDIAIRRATRRQQLEPLGQAPEQRPELVALGQMLFFDRILSGNGDTSCASCHHPLFGTGDELALPVGTGPENPGELSLFRIKGEGREFIPRNAPELFNRGAPQWHSQFWDGRVAVDYNGFSSPAGELLPDGLDSVLAVQAMFPVTSRDEMRGTAADGGVSFDYDGVTVVNNIAEIENDDLLLIWSTLTARLLSIPEYRSLFAAAYDVEDSDLESEIGFQHAANAIAAFEIAAFSFSDSPWDRYLAGDNGALTTKQKVGALLFYEGAGCSNCHSGTLMTDQSHHNLLVPEIGPGKVAGMHADPGVSLITGKASDDYCFRTPPLRNVAATGPWFHNGAYNNLRDVIRHHANPTRGFLAYNPEECLDQPELREGIDLSASKFSQMMLTFSWNVIPKRHIRRDEVDALEDFLHALTAPKLYQRMQQVIPTKVPSGLPVDGQ